MLNKHFFKVLLGFSVMIVIGLIGLSITDNLNQDETKASVSK
jgi:hypothetical protein